MLMVRDKSFYKSLLLIALPAAFQSLISFGVNMTDTVMVGALGEEALSAVSLGNQVSVFMMMFIKGVSAGTAVMISQYWGKKDMSRIKNIFAIGFQASLGIALLFFVGAFFFPKSLMSVLTNNQALINRAPEYLTMVAFSYLLYAVTENFIVMLRNVEIVRISLVISGCSFVMNLIGNYVLIFGKLGFPAMGIRGAAVSTVITRACELLVVAAYLAFFDRKLHLQPLDLLRGKKEMWIDYIKYGVPMMAADVLWGMVNTGKQMIMGRLGTDAVAANSIADVVLQLAMMFVTGLASASGVLVGKSVGAKRYDLTRQYSKTIQVLFFFLGIGAALLTYFIRDFAISFYNVSDSVKELARQYLFFGALTIWGTGYAAGSFQGINRGAGDVNFVLNVNLICGWLIVIPLCALGAFVWHVPAPVVFFFTRIDQILKVFIAFFRLRSDRWIRNVTRDSPAESG